MERRAARLVAGERLSMALAERLHAQMPSGIGVVGSRSAVTVIREDGLSAVTAVGDLVDQPGELTQLIESAAWVVLSSVQDFVSEEIKDLWPFSPTACPHAVVEDGELKLWYGEQRRLTLASIAIGSLLV